MAGFGHRSELAGFEDKAELAEFAAKRSAVHQWIPVNQQVISPVDLSQTKKISKVVVHARNETLNTISCSFV